MVRILKLFVLSRDGLRRRGVSEVPCWKPQALHSIVLPYTSMMVTFEQHATVITDHTQMRSKSPPMFWSYIFTWLVLTCALRSLYVLFDSNQCWFRGSYTHPRNSSRHEAWSMCPFHPQGQRLPDQQEYEFREMIQEHFLVAPNTTGSYM